MNLDVCYDCDICWASSKYNRDCPMCELKKEIEELNETIDRLEDSNYDK